MQEMKRSMDFIYLIFLVGSFIRKFGSSVLNKLDEYVLEVELGFNVCHHKLTCFFLFV